MCCLLQSLQMDGTLILYDTICVFKSIINHLTFLFSLPSFFFSYVASFLASLISFNPVTYSVNFFNFSYYEAKTHKELDKGLTNSLILKG